MRSRLFFSRSLLVLLVVLCAACVAFGQTKKLREVRVQGRKKEQPFTDLRLADFASGMQQVVIDSALLHQYALQQVSQLLAQQTSVFVRAYGINGIATLNFRGASSAQSQVLWNGVPLNSASVGATDISLLSTNQFSRVQLLYGGSAALLGSGNVGGALLLDNDWETRDTLSYHSNLAVEYGSFGQIRGNVKQRFQSGRWTAGLNLNGRVAKNNFPFTDLQGKQQVLTHATLGAGSLMAQMSYAFSDSSFIRTALWTQQYTREIPAALFETLSRKRQYDQSTRALLHAQYAHRAQVWYGKFSLSRERLHFDDSLISLYTDNRVGQIYSELGWRAKLGRVGELLVFAPLTFSAMKSDHDTIRRGQNRWALAVAYSKELFQGSIRLNASARGEKVGVHRFLLPGMNLVWHPFRAVTFRANLQRSYRLPTLNELYFNPGGNPQLKPEQGWSADMGYRLELPVSTWLSLHQESSVFARRMRDWIFWFGGAIWTPHNIATVYSRGIETTNTMTCRIRPSVSCWIGLNTSFVLATTVASYQPGDGSIGKQIPYSPRYNGQVNAGCSWRQFRVNYNHTYTGYRFITVDESGYLAPYRTGNLYLSWTKSLGRYTLVASAFVTNLWNTSYQVVAGRPVPGRNAGLGFGFSL